VVFFYELGLSNRALNAFIFEWGVIPRQILNAIANPLTPASIHAFETLITSQFLHAGWLHIIGNMLFLFVFGDNIEDVMGSILYLIFYVLCGIVAGLAQTFVLSPFLGGQTVPSIGASGAIAGVLGAYIVLYPTARVRVLVPIFIFLSFEVPAIFMLGIWFLQQFFLGVTSLNVSAAQTGGVAFWAHIGGFIAGIVMILPFFPKAQRLKAARVTRFPQTFSSYEDYRRWRG
jgi:membrane associated rhomboid family serine protease